MAASSPLCARALHRLGLSGLVFALGFQAVITQSLLLREALVLMFGSELVWGAVLFAWLAGVALGGAAGGWLESRLERVETGLVVLTATLSIAACLELWLFRGVRAWLGIETGELLPLPTTLWVAVVLVTPVGVLVGTAFPLACRLAEREFISTGAGPLGRIYAVESLGSLFGGAVFSFWAIERFPPIEIALLCGVLTFIACAALLASSHRRVCSAVCGGLAVVSFGIFILAGDRLNEGLVAKRWKTLAAGYELVAEGESRYQNLAVARLAGQYTLFTDGQAAADFPDPYTFVPPAHLWMCQHPSPAKVLVLGGGAEGLLTPILEHPIEQVDYVEPDFRQIEIIEPFLSEADRQALNDVRVKVHHQDARFLIKSIRDRFDLVIARLPEPTSASRARFFTREFFGELRRTMTRRSVLCMTVASTPGELTPVSGEYLASVTATLKSHFPSVVVGWGDPAQIFAATEAGLVTTDPLVLRQRYSDRKIQSEWFDPVWFEGATDWLEPEKVARRANELAVIENVQVSTDLHPIVYLQRLVLWDRMTGGRAANFINRLRSLDWRALSFLTVLSAGAILVGTRLRCRSTAGWAKGAVTLSITTTGFATMALSIIWLFAFQNLYGYVYQRIGWIIALFMAGLVIGSAWMSRHPGRDTRSLWSRLIAIDVALAILAATVPLLLHALGRAQSSPWSFVLVEGVISTLVVSTGILGGAAFAIAGGLQLTAVGRAGRAAGTVVAADHAGACAGALLTGILLVPVYGTVTTAFVLGGLKLSSAAGLAIASTRVGAQK